MMNILNIRVRTTIETSPCVLSPGCQGWNEQPLKALQSSFGVNHSFFRPGADVVAIIFSDSDEAAHIQQLSTKQKHRMLFRLSKSNGETTKD